MYPAADSKYAASKYSGTQNQIASTYDIISSLLRVLISQMQQAKALYGERRYDRMFDCNKKSFRILLVLRASTKLDPEEMNPDIIRQAKFLYQRYDSMYVRLVNIASNKEALQEFDALITETQEIYNRWREVGQEPIAAHPPHTHAMPSGNAFY